MDPAELDNICISGVVQDFLTSLICDLTWIIVSNLARNKQIGDEKLSILKNNFKQVSITQEVQKILFEYITKHI